MTSNPFLFIGFSLDDPNFDLQLRGIQDIFAGTAGRHYALIRESERDRIDRLSLPVDIITFSDFGQPLRDLVRTLGDIATQDSESNTYSAIHDTTVADNSLTQSPSKNQEELKGQFSQTDDINSNTTNILEAENSASIFISYHHKEPDKTLAQNFANALNQIGHKAFIDTSIDWGSNWASKIQEELEKCDYLLVLLSPEAAARETVVEEIALAKELAENRPDKRPTILPIRVCYPFTEPLPYQISAYLRLIQQEYWDNDGHTPPLIDKLLQTVTNRNNWPKDPSETSQPGSVQHHGPLPSFDPRDFIRPGGALAADARVYTVRDADEDVLKTLRFPRAMVQVHGPRQTGKTSLIVRVYKNLRETEGIFRAAFIDFQSFSSEEFQSTSTIWRAIATEIANQLDIDSWDSSNWQLSSNDARNFTRFLDQHIFQGNSKLFLICIDEIDRVLSKPVKSDFFPILRSFYNRGAYDETFRKIQWLIGTSLDASFFIEDLNQSPFNHADNTRVDLSAFSSAEVMELADRLSVDLNQKTLKRILDFVGGHPYLVHLLLYHMARDSEPYDALFDPHISGRDIFHDHLRRYLLKFQKEPELAEAMKNIVNGIECKDIRIIDRLKSEGLTDLNGRPSKTAHRPCPLFGPPCPSPKPSNLGHSNVI